MTTSSPSSSILSPPNSQDMPTVSPTVNGANSNGKRPHTALSDRDELDNMMASGNGRMDFPAKTHQQSGYSWSRAEDEPGYAWLSKKSVDEGNRAWDGLVHREGMVKGMFSCVAAVWRDWRLTRTSQGDMVIRWRLARRRRRFLRRCR